MGDGVDQRLGQLDEARRRAVQAIAQRGLHLRMLPAQQVGAPGTHEVDDFAAVHVRQPAAEAALEELRMAGR
jgi:hypothetical protein